MSNAQTFFPYSTLYISGLNLAWASNTTLTINGGLCRDSTNSWDITPGQPSYTLNAAVNGVNGLDVGTLAASTWYAVYVIKDTTHQNVDAVLLSLSATTPTLPPGPNGGSFGVFRRIGWARTNSSIQFYKFYQSGNANDRFYQWDAIIQVLSSGTATTFTAQSLIAGAPVQSNQVSLIATYTPNSAANSASIRPTGSATAPGSAPVVLKNSAAAAGTYSNVNILPLVVTNAPSIDYVVGASDALSLYVSGFQDSV